MRRAEEPPVGLAACCATGEGPEGGLARRGFLSAGAVALGLAATGCTAPSAPHARRLSLTLRPPSGPYQIGTVSLHLVDHSRPDPWLHADRPRELMISAWYPARDDDRYPRAPWMPPKAGALFRTQLIPSP